LLEGGGERYVSNDRLLVDLGHEPPFARGMPTIVALREATLARFPAVEGRLRARGYTRHHTLAEMAAGRSTGPSGEAPAWPPSLTPAQVCALAGADATGGGPLAAVLLPRMAPAVARFEVRRLSPGPPAADRLRDSLLIAELPERPAAAFDDGGPPVARDDTALRDLCAAFGDRVPCFDVALGPAAYETNGGASLWRSVREVVG
jgi:hypothetical protein